MTGPVGHLNWAYLNAPWGHPAVAGFTDHVDAVNAAAERSPGFVARPEIDAGDFKDFIRVSGGRVNLARIAATLSVWESAEALDGFVHRTIHGRFLERRAEWFVPQGVATYVIWPVAAGHVPPVWEAKAAMRRLWSDGTSDAAYDFAWLKARAA